MKFLATQKAKNVQTSIAAVENANSLMSFEKDDIEYQFLETLSELQRFIVKADAVFKIAELSPEPTINIHFDDFDFILSLNKNKTKILEFLNDRSRI